MSVLNLGGAEAFQIKAATLFNPTQRFFIWFFFFGGGSNFNIYMHNT